MKLSLWPDGGHDDKITGKNSGSDKTEPTTAAYGVTTQSDYAPSAISNKSYYSSLAELGHIFDPAQWANLTLASASPKNKSGGGATLRIGQAEYPPFDKAGLRARELLPLFSLNKTRRTKGLVNINTASRETLRALAAGVPLDEDPLFLDPSPKPVAPNNKFYPPQSSAGSAAADALADAIIAERQRQPFATTIALGDTKVNAAPYKDSFFGNIITWQNSPAPKPTQLNDMGKEQLFRKIFNLTSVRSRNFMIWVTGRSYDEKGNLVATRSRAFQVFVQPNRDASTGQIIVAKPPVVTRLFTKDM